MFLQRGGEPQPTVYGFSRLLLAVGSTDLLCAFLPNRKSMITHVPPNTKISGEKIILPSRLICDFFPNVHSKNNFVSSVILTPHNRPA